MKKLIFTLLVFMTICATAKADPFRFGVIAGMNMTKGEVDHSYHGWSSDSENGWFAGLQLKVTLPVVGLGLDASVVYSRETATISTNEAFNFSSQSSASTETLVEKKHIDYLAIPLHLRYDLELPAISYAFVPYIFTGPQVGLAMTKIDNSIHLLDEKFNSGIKNKDLVWRYDLGLGAILLNRFQVSYSYSFPLTNTIEEKVSVDGAKALESDYKQGVHRISLTYFF